MDWEIILQNISGVVIIIGTVGLLMVAIGGLGFWILGRIERRRIRKDLMDRHDEIWDGYASSEYYCWLKIRWELEQKDATTAILDELSKLIRECERRRENYRTIMLETGRPIRVTRTERQE